LKGITVETIFKYEVPMTPGVSTIRLPKGAEILYVGIQHSKPYFWAEINDGKELEPVMFRTFVTGEQTDKTGWSYVGSYQIEGGCPGGYFVGHLYQVKP